MTPSTHATATLTSESDSKISNTLTPTVHDNATNTQNTITTSEHNF